MKTYSNFVNEGKVVTFDDKNEGNFIILMGGPGAGKTTISKNLFDIRNVRIFNVDVERELVAKKLGLNLNIPEDNDKILDYTHSSTDPNNRTIKLLKSTLRQTEYDTHLPNILFDTVGTHVDLIKELLTMAKEKGYETTMVYIKCDLDIALERNRRRTRRLSDEVVTDYHNRVAKTFDVLFPLYDHAWVVDNSQPYTSKRKDIVKRLR